MENSKVKYLFTLLTSGIYGFFWLFEMAESSKISNYTLKRNVFTVTFILFLSLTLYEIFKFNYAIAHNQIDTYVNENPTFPYWLLILGALVYAIAFNVLNDISKYINAKGVTAPKGIKLCILFIFYFAALPLLQNRLKNVT